MGLWFTKKDREIANLNAKVKNRDKLIDDQARTIEGLKIIINSLEEDLKSAREASFENAKEAETKNIIVQEVKPVKIKRTRTTKKETISKTSTSKK